MYKRGGKRAFDLLLAALALVILMPVIGIISVLVRVKLGSPVLFRQQRPGLHGRPFAIYKFRTMFDARDAQGNLLPDKDRLSPFVDSSAAPAWTNCPSYGTYSEAT